MDDKEQNLTMRKMAFLLMGVQAAIADLKEMTKEIAEMAKTLNKDGAEWQFIVPSVVVLAQNLNSAEFAAEALGKICALVPMLCEGMDMKQLAQKISENNDILEKEGVEGLLRRQIEKYKKDHPEAAEGSTPPISGSPNLDIPGEDDDGLDGPPSDMPNG